MYKSILYPLILILVMSIFVACEDFLDPNQELVLRESDIPGDEVELRSISLGLYALQQDLVEQIVILGELRGDLVEITDNADPDLVEVNNFQISQGNRYISPVNFYKLIAASNKMIRILKNKFPEVLDKESAISNHHKMYGEAICMRSWAYFNAVRIYNEIPYIPETLTDISEIDQFVNSSGTYIDSTFIDYHQNGFDNDTTIKVYEYTERRFLDQDAITKLCINDIEEGIRDGGVGVDYSFDNYDETWNVTIWGEYSMNALLGQMYLHIGDYVKAMKNFNVFLAYGDSHGGAHRFGLDDLFSNDRWGNIFTSINENEHIFTVWFGKSSLSFQRNSLQSYFSAKAPNLYALKPTRKAVELWETVWKGKDVSLNSQNPNSSRLIEPGVPGDFSRGNGVSYAYIKNGDQLDDSEVAKMLELKYLDNQNELTEFMEGVDTVVYKYTLGKSNPFAHDAYFMIYRAAGIHLYAAEIYANWKAFHGGSLPVEFLNKAEMYIYDGKYRNDPRQLGVAGRVGLGDKEGITVGEHIIYDFHPYNNEIIGYKTIATKLEKQRYLEEIVLDERARELAFEGERFYDIVRIARRRNKVGLDGSGFLATIISEKFPASEREQIKNLLQNPDNWYLPFTLR